MNPVLKYRGGKSREIPRFLQYIPDYFKNYAVNIKNRFKNDKIHIVVKNY